MDHILKIYTLFILLPVNPCFIIQGKTAFINIDKAAFYAAMAGVDLAEINSMLDRLKESTIPEKTAYEGALLMRKSGLVSKPKDKINIFKSGRTKMEYAIKNEEENAEYHFLRLIIQENAPKIVKYKGDLKKDADLVRRLFKKLSPVVQQAVRDYSKKSTILKPTDF